MRYNNIKRAEFLSRPNRFIAEVMVDGERQIAHVKNTGRCKELLTPNATIFLQECDSESRKTKYDLISVYKGDRLINMDSQVPNKVFAEYVYSGLFMDSIVLVRSETKYKNSRFDFYLETPERKIFVEVKGVTLEENNICMFPDAPTERGVKHINELVDATQNGFEAYIVFIIQMSDVEYFTPNDRTHKAFGDALRYAAENGVNIVALTCDITETEIIAASQVPVLL